MPLDCFYQSVSMPSGLTFGHFFFSAEGCFHVSANSLFALACLLGSPKHWRPVASRLLLTSPAVQGECSLCRVQVGSLSQASEREPPGERGAENVGL